MQLFQNILQILSELCEILLSNVVKHTVQNHLHFCTKILIIDWLQTYSILTPAFLLLYLNISTVVL